MTVLFIQVIAIVHIVVDHRKLIGNTMLAVETDENAHRGYDEKDEEIRYDDLYMIHSGK
jgi:hypothetical protein